MEIKDKLEHGIVTGGWVSPPHAGVGGKDFISDEQYAFCRECGIDLLYTMYENPKLYGNVEIARALLLAHKHRVGLIVGDYRLSGLDGEALKELIEFYQSYPAFFGLNLYDEPGIAHFDGIERQRTMLKNAGLKKICYVNLLPMYALSTILKGCYRTGDSEPATPAEYLHYLESFIEKFGAEVLSYDFYPFHYESKEYDKNYFKQLSLVRKYAKKAEIPFWVFIQITAWNKKIREMSEYEIAWQVNTALAYGAVGIQYFTYWTPFSSDAESYRGGIMEQDGRRGKSFDVVKKLNRFIHKIGSRLRNAEHEGVLVPCGFQEEFPAEDRIENIDGLEILSSDNIMLGVFRGETERVLFAVNLSLDSRSSIRCRLAEDKSAEAIRLSGRSKYRNVLSIRLDCGEGALIRIFE